MIRPLRIGSLFSGIGGLELGLERGLATAGVPTRTLFQVEQNEYARAVLARHWPHAERYTDVRDITAETVAPVDLLCGGFPCQDISLAGKGAGLAGEKSGLFFEMARIIRELRPRLVVMENVPAITGRGLSTVLSEVAACGYDARWGMLRANDPMVGAPHRRERWFCVAWLADADRSSSHRRADQPGRSAEGRAIAIGDGPAELANHDRQRGEARTRLPAGTGMAYPDSHRHKRANRKPKPDRQDWRSAVPERQAKNNRSKPGMVYTNKPRLQRLRGKCKLGEGSSKTKDHRADKREIEPGMDRNANGLPARLDIPHRWPAPPGPQHPHEPPRTRPRQPHDRDRLKALGNAVVPQCAEVIGRWIGCELLS